MYCIVNRHDEFFASNNEFYPRGSCWLLVWGIQVFATEEDADQYRTSLPIREYTKIVPASEALKKPKIRDESP